MCLLTAAGGCGRSMEPTGPSTLLPAAELVAPDGLRMEFAPSVSNSEIRLTWNPVQDATYVVELGDAPGSVKYGSFDVTATSFAFRDLPNGRVFARVKSRRGGTTSSPTADVSDWFLDMKDYVEALFLGTGPLVPTDGNHGCSATGWVRGFGRGTTVPLSVSTTVSSDKVAVIHGVADQVAVATAGAMQVAFGRTNNPNPTPGQNAATSTTHPTPVSEGCGGNGGCTIHVFVNPVSPGRFYSSRAVQPAGQTPEAYGHDAVGHGVLGLCHVDGNLIGGARRSLMSAGPGVFSGDIADRLTEYDLAAVQVLYATGLGAGARGRDLLNAGIINP